MQRLVALLVIASVAAPAHAWAQSARMGGAAVATSPAIAPMGGMHPGVRPPLLRPRPPIARPPFVRPPFARPPFAQQSLAGFGCCWDSADYAYLSPPPAAAYEPEPPQIVYVIPSPPPLVYVPTPRVEPTPEIKLATGQWERHGNGKEYPYTWVWQPAYGTRR